MKNSGDWDIYWWAVINAPCECQVTIDFLKWDFTRWKFPINFDWEFTIEIGINIPPTISPIIPWDVRRSYEKAHTSFDEAELDVDDIPF